MLMHLKFVSSDKRYLIFCVALPGHCQTCLLTGLQTPGELRPQYNPYPPRDSTHMGLYFITPPVDPASSNLPSGLPPRSGDLEDVVAQRFFTSSLHG